MFAILYTPTCTAQLQHPDPPLLSYSNDGVPTCMYIHLAMHHRIIIPNPSTTSHITQCLLTCSLRKIFVLFLFKVYIINSQSVESDHLLE